MCNQEVRQKAKEAGITLWRIADELSVCEMTLTRKLRRELPQAEKDKLLTIIELLQNEREQEAG